MCLLESFHSTLHFYQEGSTSLLSFWLLQEFWVCPLLHPPSPLPLHTVWYLIVAATQTQGRVSRIGSFSAQGTQELWGSSPISQMGREKLERKDLPEDNTGIAVHLGTMFESGCA